MPPVTADRTPERLSAEDRRELFAFLPICGQCGKPFNKRACGIAHAMIANDPLRHRLLAPLVAALRAECDVLREQTTQVEALMKRRDLGPVGFRRALDAALHPQDPDHERTSG